MLIGRKHASATVWQGKIYVMGGYNLSNGEVCTKRLERPIEL